MKRIITFILCLSLSIFLVSCGKNDSSQKNGIESKADLNTPSDPIYKQVYDLLIEYVGSGQYTKLTTLKYSDDAANYHAGVNGRQRRTYYDETVNALLMGNYDGSFTSINSGYAKVESDMWHYSHNDLEGISIANLFVQEKMNHDYSVYETSPNKFFDNLTTLANAANAETTESRWSVTDGVYKYNPGTPATVYGAGRYTNGLLKVFQYFSAPMLLLNNGIHLQIATIQEIQMNVGGIPTNVLVLKIFDSSNIEISEAIIVKGLTRAVVTTI